MDTFEDFKNKVKEKLGEDYQILSKKEEYKTQQSKVKVLHTKCGTIYETTARNLIRGMGCRKCSYKITGEKQKGKSKPKKSKSTEFFTEQMKKAIGDDYILIGNYKNSYTPITVKHLTCGTIFHPLPHNILSNHSGCPKCAIKSYSKAEKSILEFIKTFYHGKIIENFREHYEIDIYLPEINLGFEYCGLYWHSEKKVPKDYHISKMEYFKSKGIMIFQIFEDEWKKDKENIQRIIKNLIIKPNLESIKIDINNDKILIFSNNEIINSCDYMLNGSTYILSNLENSYGLKEMKKQLKNMKIILDLRWNDENSFLTEFNEVERIPPKEWFILYNRRESYKFDSRASSLWDCGYIVLENKKD